MAIQNLYPSIRPTLSLDFANTKRLDSRITFTRSTGATYYDGKTVAKAEENLLKYSQEFDNSYWLSNSLANGSISTNTVETLAPDGTNTADKFVGAATSSVKIFGKYWNNAPIIWSGTGTFSVFAKYGNSQHFHAVCTKAESTGYYGRIVGDLQNGTITDSSGVSDYGVQNVGNGWYRFWFTFNHSSTAFQIELGLVPNSSGNAYDGNGRLTTGSETPANSNFYIWGAQLEQRSSVTAYTPTTSQPITNYLPVLQSAAANVARFDHDPITGESKGLLIEEQRTNLLTYSSEFANTVWGGVATPYAVSNIVVAPDGTLSADTTVRNTTTTNEFPFRYATAQAVSTTYAASVFAKAGTSGNKLYMRNLAVDNGLTTGLVRFDLAAGTVDLTYGSTYAGKATMTAVGNGWYRCAIVGTTTASIATNYLDIGITSSGTVGGTAGDFLYLWGAQLEAGSFATSYIPTTTSQVTRSADSASMTGTNFSSWYNPKEGTVYGESSLLGRPSASTAGFFQVRVKGNGLMAYQNTVGYLIAIYDDTNATSAADTNASAVGTPRKFATAFSSAGIIAAWSGVMGSNAAYNGSFAAATGVDIGTLGNWNGTIKRIAYYPKRLSNTELQGITS